MKLEQTFEVQAPIERVWEALIDLERVAPCLPGATITGRLARFGRGGMIEDISNRLMRDFSACLQSRIVAAEPAPSGEAITTGEEAPEAAAGADADPAPAAPPPPPPPPAKPISGFSLFFGALWDRIRRMFGGGRRR